MITNWVVSTDISAIDTFTNVSKFQLEQKYCMYTEKGRGKKYK